MMPPICTICDKDFRFNMEEGGLVYFVPEKEEIPSVGNDLPHHPDHACWFCGEHIAQARSLEHLTAREALGIMRGAPQ